MNQTAELLKQTNNGKIISFEGPVCPYCGEKSILRPETFIYKGHYTDKLFWVCKNHPVCNSYVGTHGHGEWMNFPLGRLANKELRVLKTNAHTLFDHLWRTKTFTRGYMYQWMQQTMSLTEPQAHIGELDEEGCQKLIDHLNDLYSRTKVKT